MGYKRAVMIMWWLSMCHVYMHSVQQDFAPPRRMMISVELPWGADKAICPDQQGSNGYQVPFARLASFAHRSVHACTHTLHHFLSVFVHTQRYDKFVN